jgi:hypothetical protein
MGAHKLGTLTALAYRGDALEVTELGLEPSMRYVIRDTCAAPRRCGSTSS